MNQTMRDRIFMISSIAVIIGALLPLLAINTLWASYLFAVGAAGIAVCRLTYRYKGKNFRLKRLHHIETFSALFLLVSSYFMFKGNLDWVMFLMVFALLQLYTAIVIPREERKEEAK